MTGEEPYEFETPLAVFDKNLYGHHLKVPQEAVDRFCEGKDRRVRVTLNGHIERPCAIMPHPKGHYLLMNQEVRKKLKITKGDRVRVSMVKDRSKYGTPLPEELEACFDADLEAFAHFEALSPGNQRSLIHIVSKIKSSDKRITKSLAILHHLREVQGKLDYKRLNETIKEFNRRSDMRI